MLGLLLTLSIGVHVVPGRVLRLDVLPAAPRVPTTLIVGRARCGAQTWLLTDTGELVRLEDSGPRLSVRRVDGLRDGERPWGLACLDDGSLWTMTEASTQARLTADGRIVARLEVSRPRVGLFGAGDHLLAQEIPPLVGSPALLASPPGQPRLRMPWAGLVIRRAGSAEDQLTRNLVTCGLPLHRFLPCWFADEQRIVVSDGAAARTISLAHLGSVLADALVPIWDVALVPDGAWLLATGARPDNGHRVGGRLVRLDANSRPLASLDLKPAARLIVSADADGCVLVAADGRLVEVSWR